MRKPDNISYWLEDTPPVQIALLLAVQQMSFLAVYLVVSPLFARSFNLSHEQSLQLISATLLASSIGVLLQSLRRFGIGSGLFCPLQATSSTFGALSIAKTAGGLGAIFGAAAAMGVAQIAFAHLFVRLRGILNIQVAGIAVMLIGLGLGHHGLRLVVAPRGGELITQQDAIICLLTLGTMLLCNVWSSRYLRLFSAFLGLLAGVISSLVLDAIPPEKIAMVQDAPLFYLPKPMGMGWKLELESIPPVIITGLFLALHGFGAITAAQRFNDADWKRPDMALVKQGVVAEGLTNIINSLLNGLPLTSSGGAVSLAAATGCTSRYIALWLAAIMALLAFMPKAILFLEILPDPVMGCAMLFLASFTLMAGLQIIASRLLDNRKILTIGFGLILGISFESVREVLLKAAPDIMRQLLFSGVGVGVMAAVVLGALFRIGDRTHRSHRFDARQSSLNDVVAFLEQQGKSWGARADVVNRAEYATWQAFEILTEHDLVTTSPDGSSRIEMKTIFNEYSFTVLLHYHGINVPLAMEPPSHEQMIENDDAVLQMAGYMLRRLADRVTAYSTSAGCELRLVFND
jgi:NCS2 family nucleobase:cation symporter-2